MRISIVQPDIIWENKSENFKKLERLISDIHQGTDILILPEMFNTGFSMRPELLSEPARSITFDWMISIAEKYNAGVCGSYIIREKNKFFNRWVFVTPDHKTRKYDKRHLFTLGEGEAAFSHGKKRLVFSFRGVRISPAICYDLRFPVWSRNRNDYDLLINSANWPSSRHSVWTILLKARAIENQCYVAGSNRTGIDGTGIEYCGASMLINPKGEIISSLINENEGTLTGEISMTELADFRKEFPVLNDADRFSINL